MEPGPLNHDLHGLPDSPAILSSSDLDCYQLVGFQELMANTRESIE